MTEATELAKPADKIHQVFQWIVAGHSEHDIVESIEAKWPGDRARPLIIAAMKRIASSGDADPSSVRGWCIEAARSIYQASLAAGDFASALRAVKAIHDYAGA